MLGVSENEMPSERLRSACLAATAGYWTVVQTGSDVTDRPESGRRLVSPNFSIENKGAKHVVLRFQVTSKGCRLHTLITNVALYPETLPGGVSGCPMAKISVYFLRTRNSNPNRNARHDFRLLCIGA